MGVASHDIVKFLSILHFEPDSLFEIRIPSKKGPTMSGFFRDKSIAAKCIDEHLAINAQNIYVTLNPIRDDAFKASNKIAIRKHTTENAHILKRNWLYVDLDPFRPSGLAASDLQLEGAIKTADRMERELQARGWPKPLRAMSGNGAYLLFRVDQPNSKEVAELFRDVLHQFKDEFGAKGNTNELRQLGADPSVCNVDVDISVHNAARIVKVIGTWSRKGDHTEERPHRHSYFMEE